MNTHAVRRFCAFFSIVCALMISSTTTIAQDDPSAILLESAEAMKAAPGIGANIILKGDGKGEIAKTLPSMTGRVMIGEHSTYGKSMHMIGQLTPQQGADPETFDIMYTPTKYIWADHDKTVFNIRPPSVSARQRPDIFSYLMLAELLKENPFEKLISDAESIELKDNETINGQDCRVIMITKPKAKPGQRNFGGHTHEQWFISTSDNLPRRIDHITDAGFIKVSIITELSSLTIAAQTDAQLEVFKPEHFRVSDTTVKPKPRSVTPTNSARSPSNATTNGTRTDRPTQPTTRGPSTPPAPNFNFRDTDGNEVTRSSQTGRVTVLYFHGSWSLPSTIATPKVDEMIRSFDNQIDAFGVAIREANPGTAESRFNNASASMGLTINPESDMEGLFKVKVYPTLVVINEDARIVYSKHPTKESTIDDVIDGAKDAISKLFESTDP